jgi:hypothetical protein
MQPATDFRNGRLLRPIDWIGKRGGRAGIPKPAKIHAKDSDLAMFGRELLTHGQMPGLAEYSIEFCETGGEGVRRTSIQ